MKIYAQYKKVTIYPHGDFWITEIFRRQRLNPVQFGTPSKAKNAEYMRSLLKYYGFELVKFKELPE